jgi:hypothetical protein
MKDSKKKGRVIYEHEELLLRQQFIEQEKQNLKKQRKQGL